ncbi:phage tail sheath family protein [Polyangium mundeleinium]|uniref:Phage tail sheath subtilisin-like domain-containing protein n=1 Tax=Polyangium mundeleinium TaxID=2995306 RepID=A0ABT5F405_9BACT|nr:phage tail sheath subtilisin-like domain-containing protein [Polyangium mundeleinium]MDC0747867.1 phage tail sheath subtilisin-like domain-containing protein [Polyangium mundeleinium]
MPEYLAPAVYVEETSFRSKSIEGVSTSTTGFAGPARKGPVGEPELVTSFADFARLFGGLADLDLGQGVDPLNYLAHAVRAYFNEGGGRLYVARVFGGDPETDGIASLTFAVGGHNVTLAARFPGSTGNGKFVFRGVRTPAADAALAGASEGTIAVVTANASPAAAKADTALGPTFDLKNLTTLALIAEANNVATPKTITFKGKSAEVTSDTVGTPGNVTIANGEALVVEIGDLEQTIPLTTGTSLEAIAIEINKSLRGGYAFVSGATLVLGTDAAGTGARIEVKSSPATIAFTTPLKDNANDTANNNVPDIHAVGVSDIQARINAENLAVKVFIDKDGKLTFATTATGSKAKITVEGTGTANAALGFDTQANTVGEGDGSATDLFFKKLANGNWADADGNTSTAAQLLAQGDVSLLSLSLTTIDADGDETTYENLAVDKAHPRFIGNVLPPDAKSRADHLGRLFSVTVSTNVDTFDLLTALLANSGVRQLAGGDDGGEPVTASYAKGFAALGGVEDISIIAAPGSSAYTDAHGIRTELIAAAETRRAYRIAVVDPPKGLTISEVQTLRAKHDSTRAALYYPWVVVPNPLARPGSTDPRELVLPPSGFVCGIYARSDVERGVWKAPANEVVRSALRFDTDVNFAEQEVLNPIGINCLRYLSGRGYRVWGARTMSSDPEWKYVNVRRYFNYIERSIDVGTQWAVFEPNGERLWANVRETIGSFLYNEWRSGALLGADAKQAYFVRCDRSTMTQNDLDNGRLICLVGVAVVKPAEFVIFRIGQKTADAGN